MPQPELAAAAVLVTDGGAPSPLLNEVPAADRTRTIAAAMDIKSGARFMHSFFRGRGMNRERRSPGRFRRR
ncbi:hypothetical protein GCM10014715_06490 [Streptomyces spiralis]|uniref:Uncharacterized protein n=1 Tax=Streptomyces spiralis TaxID=66376 RepID=A0A919DLD0_9ACTN|nr:hypothetical protein GCM10014715_06490 [Streptomyces spiralis]